MVMTTKLREGADQDEKRVYRRLESVRQPVELKYSDFFSIMHFFKHTDSFHLFNKAEMPYRTGIVGFFC